MSAWRPGACGCLTAMGFTALFAIGGLASSSLAQNTPRQFNSKPASPFQEKGPEPQVLPNARALQAFIRRNTAGFPPPDPLPAAALPKPPTEPRPQAGEPLKPGSLRDLFKK